MSLARTDSNDLAPSSAERCYDGITKLRQLSLTNFRSYTSARLNLDGRPVTFHGSNGAGKTNILEAISLLGPGRGLRSARLDELPRVDGDGGWAVSAHLATEFDTTILGIGTTAQVPDRRICRIDEQSASGPASLSDHLRLLWLTPAQDRLFMEGASERRRFLDRMALAHDNTHGKSANIFEKAMRQRQKLLDDRSGNDAWLSGLEAQMAEAGVAVAAARRDIAKCLAAAQIGKENEIFPTAEISLDGTLEAALEHQPSAQVEDDYIDHLKHLRHADTIAGRATVGPHKSDLLVRHREKDLPARLCSTGEQKALLIGLVLTNARVLSNVGNLGIGPNTPLIMLLDEIAAHLDPDRRTSLFDILEDIGFQTFMTGTDQSLFSGWQGRAQQFAIENGSITEIQLS